jgi:diguanylate cyclase (GGDEF)-like protein/PAS domain S-box-containing protein
MEQSIEYYKNIDFYEVDLSNKIIIIYFNVGVKKNNLEITIDEYLQYIHDEDKNKVINKWDKLNAVSIGEKIKYEMRIKDPNTDNYHWYNTVIQKTSQHKYYGVQMEITDFKEAQLRLIETKENYEMIINNSTDLIIKYSLQGEIIYASPSYCKMFGMDEAEVLTKSFHDFEKYLSVTNDEWYKEVVEPPYFSQRLICIDSHVKENIWISWTNNAVFKAGKIAYIISVGHDVTEIIKINEKLEYQLNHDSLTGLYNRRGIYNELNKMDSNTRIVSFFIDINNFKYINDYYGHKTGDTILKKIGEKLLDFEAYGCIVGRLSGDEFIVLLADFDNNSLDMIKDYLFASLNQSVVINDLQLYLSSSIGYAIYPDDTFDFETLISYSDLAMYEAKSALIVKEPCRFDFKMYEKLKQHINITNDIRAYVEANAIDIVYQAVVNHNDLSVKYLEVLSRWKHKTEGDILPEVFFSIAEKTGFVEELDFYVIKNALKDYKVIKQMNKYTDCKLSLNVTSSTLLNLNFPQQLQALIKENDLATKDICIEINENIFVKYIKSCISQIKALKEVGVLIALDNFGSKFSSLAILEEVNFDVVKIDRNFTSKIDIKPIHISILKMVRDIALTNNMDVIIVGAETEAQIEILKRLGLNLIQSFVYSKPDQIRM